MPCAKFNVRGRVQGVFFRASTRNEAQRLGLTGYVKNLPDGSVEILACGNATAIDELERWLHIGPPAARVDTVTRKNIDVAAPAAFTTA
ncbi:MAG: acylphosphatase [Rudaea sp.]